MATIEVQIPALPLLRSALRDYPKIAEPLLQRAVQATGDVLAKYTTRRTVPFRTGRLLQSFIAQYGRLQMRWMPTARYAIFVHEGTKPHTILPRVKKALWWEGAAHPVKRVEHPGTKPNPFMKTIVEQAQPDIARLFQDAENRIMNEIARRTNIR